MLMSYNFVKEIDRLVNVTLHCHILDFVFNFLVIFTNFELYVLSNLSDDSILINGWY